MKEIDIANNFGGIKAKIDMIFRKLPYFMPWIWELIALAAILGLAFGAGLSAWADYTLAK